MVESTAVNPTDVPELASAIVRFAGDSGDGMQLVGNQFTHTSALVGNDLSTLPDYPSEIRAPAGTLPGVSAFQIQFGDQSVNTPGDEPIVLVAMNPAALKVHLKDLIAGGSILANANAFTAANLKKAGYESNPLTDGSLDGYRVLSTPLTELTLNAVAEFELKKTTAERCRNFFALGITYWLFDRPLEPTLKFIAEKFGKNPKIRQANEKALKSGYYYSETTEIFTSHFVRVKTAVVEPGLYRNIAGNEATALGFIAAGQKAHLPIFYGSYPITPASDVLHELAKHKNFNIKTFQAEDEISAMTSIVGASFAGNLAITGTSGPGLCLKAEAMNLAIMTELPLVILNVQRGGPSTGLPTKTEQTDLLMGMFGRNGESPIVVLSPQSPSDCFAIAFEACQIALEHMTPVIIMSEGYLGNGAEPWLITDVNDLPEIKPPFITESDNFLPYERDERNVRPWAIPGTPDLEHRLGGLEKMDGTGNVTQDPENHELMCRLRAEKIEKIADRLPLLEVNGDDEGDVLLIGWGGSYGAIRSAVTQLSQEGRSVSSIHLRYLNPFPKNLGEVMSKFKHIAIPELNFGQLSMLIRSRFMIDTVSVSKVEGQPFKVSEIKQKVIEILEGSN